MTEPKKILHQPQKKIALTPETLAKYFDHTLLKPEATFEQIENLCREALQLNVAAVCVNPVWLPVVVKMLRNHDILPITVVGFPLGASGTISKVNEARDAIGVGAGEIDMVLSVGQLKSGQNEQVRRDISHVKRVCADVPLKVILETSLLTDHEIVLVSQWCVEEGVDFVKTSTGFGTRGASLDDIKIIRGAISSRLGSFTKIKASGGIRDLDCALAFIEAGADRIGSSATVSIIQDFRGSHQ